MNIKRLITALLLVICMAGTYGFITDDDILVKVNQQLEKWSDSHPVEKVYLQFDKPYYTAGDDIWFKAYVTIGAEHQLSAFSGVLNVELINSQDSVAQSLKLLLSNGTAFGDFALADTLHEGNYRIRAYTQYMLNAGRNYIFDQAITISNAITNRVFTNTTFSYEAQNNTINATINYTNVDGTAYADSKVDYRVLLNNNILIKGKNTTDSKGNLYISLPGNNKDLLNFGRIVTALTISKGDVVKKSIPVRVMAGEADVQFFPEGGNMANGIPVKIAFKAIGVDGLGIDITGYIVNSKGIKVAQIATSHLGMGVFDLTPEAGDTYKAVIVYPDGSKGSIALPAASDNGYVLRVFESGPENIRLTIISAKGTTGQLNLIGQTAGKVYYSARGIIGSNVFSTVIPKSKFPSGIAQFTLFSSKGDPLNERLVFIQNPADKLNITVAADDQKYLPRQNVKLNIGATNSAGQPALSSLSVSVTDETQVPVNENMENNIMASLLLTSDLKGYVEQPAYYFNGNNDKTRTDLDALMLTQGYRRFEWKNVLNGMQPRDNFAPESTFTISGRVTTSTGKPVIDGKVQLVNNEHGLLRIDTVTDQNGRFIFKGLVYADSIKFLISARTAKNKKDVLITMDTVAPPPASSYKNGADFNINAGNVKAYAQKSKQLYNEQMNAGMINRSIKLKEVVIKDKFNPLKHSTNMNTHLNDQVLTGREIGMGCARFIDCLKGRLMGVRFASDIPYSTRNGKQMEVMLDGIAIPDPAKLLVELNGNDVQSIEVIRGAKAGSLGGLSGNGVIFITTKKGDEPVEGYSASRVGNNFVYYRPKGAYQARVFYSPRYDAKTNTKLADLRTTIFWKPEVLTTDGKAAIEFSNAGTKGTYRVVIEGIGDNGNIGRQVFKYSVE